MRNDVIQITGTYRYASSADLERALVAARDRLDDDEPADLDRGWLDSLRRVGTTLRIDATLSLSADRFIAAAVLETLAGPAIDGVVEAFRDGRWIDWFPSQAV